jgi:hypothetical protein
MIGIFYTREDPERGLYIPGIWADHGVDYSPLNLAGEPITDVLVMGVNPFTLIPDITAVAGQEPIVIQTPSPEELESARPSSFDPGQTPIRWGATLVAVALGVTALIVVIVWMVWRRSVHPDRHVV